MRLGRGLEPPLHIRSLVACARKHIATCQILTEARAPKGAILLTMGQGLSGLLVFVHRTERFAPGLGAAIRYFDVVTFSPPSGVAVTSIFPSHAVAYSACTKW